MVWKGVLLEESLDDDTLLKLADIRGTEVERLEGENRVMTFHKLDVQDRNRDAYLVEAMHHLKPAFYAHLCRDGEMYVVFRGAMFAFKAGDPTLEYARGYGKAQGILPEQMSFEHLIEHPWD